MLEVKKPAKKAVLDRMLANGIDTCLVGPFVSAESVDKREAAAALAQAWMAFLTALQAHGGLDEPKLVDLAIKVSSRQWSYAPACQQIIPSSAQLHGWLWTVCSPPL